MLFGLAQAALLKSPRHGSPRGKGRSLRNTLLIAGFFGACGVFAAGPAHATVVSGIQARHHDGQTFVTWLTPAGTGWTYRVYRSVSKIRSSGDLNFATLVGSVGDSSWYDRRMSVITGQVYGYRTDSTAKPLNFLRGLFVSTTEISGSYFYAVTCQASGGSEDRAISQGGNSLNGSVVETYGMPRPVYQRDVIEYGFVDAQVYTLWTSQRSTANFPRMTNRTSTPYDCAIVVGDGGPNYALDFRPHVRGGNFLEVSKNVGEYTLQMDDYLNTPDANSFWFGYAETYNINSTGNLPPINGYVCGYTMERVTWTIKWALRNFPVDPARVYVTGSSMGGIAGVMLAMQHPELIAAVMVSVPRFDMSEETDPNQPTCAFNEGELQRTTCDRLWGDVSSDLSLDDGRPVYERLNAGAMARLREAQFVPPIIAFNGRNDAIVGWAEKIPFYHAMRDARAGGTFYWDNRDHSGTTTSSWVTMQDYSYVHRFRLDRSFPALSNCSADGNPGNGMAADGDSVGTINGYVEWDTSLVDRSDSWQVSLESRDLTTRYGVRPAPESLTVDVTARRLQHFTPLPGVDYQWSVTRRSDWAVVQSGVVRLDPLGVLTVPQVKVYPRGSILAVGNGTYGIAGVDPRRFSGVGPAIAPFASPVRAAMTITVTWPGAGDASLELLDLAGRRVRGIDSGPVIAGPRTVRFDAGGLASGIYFVCARQAGVSAVRRVALLH